ncbi:hypothetical protein J1614_003342 [Plenodomus biglobosus]|nr:hypothetical protein J1614_003342 [Plenodomus biglobosus]
MLVMPSCVRPMSLNQGLHEAGHGAGRSTPPSVPDYNDGFMVELCNVAECGPAQVSSFPLLGISALQPSRSWKQQRLATAGFCTIGDTWNLSVGGWLS